MENLGSENSNDGAFDIFSAMLSVVQNQMEISTENAQNSVEDLFNFDNFLNEIADLEDISDAQGDPGSEQIPSGSKGSEPSKGHPTTSMGAHPIPNTSGSQGAEKGRVKNAHGDGVKNTSVGSGIEFDSNLKSDLENYKKRLLDIVNDDSMEEMTSAEPSTSAGAGSKKEDFVEILRQVLNNSGVARKSEKKTPKLSSNLRQEDGGIHMRAANDNDPEQKESSNDQSDEISVDAEASSELRVVRVKSAARGSQREEKSKSANDKQTSNIKFESENLENNLKTNTTNNLGSPELNVEDSNGIEESQTDSTSKSLVPSSGCNMSSNFATYNVASVGNLPSCSSTLWPLKKLFPEPGCGKIAPSSGYKSALSTLESSEKVLKSEIDSDFINQVADFYLEMSKGQSLNENEDAGDSSQNWIGNYENIPSLDGSAENNAVSSSSESSFGKITNKRRKSKQKESHQGVKKRVQETQRVWNEEIYNKCPDSCARSRPYIVIYHR